MMASPATTLRARSNTLAPSCAAPPSAPARRMGGMLAVAFDGRTAASAMGRRLQDECFGSLADILPIPLDGAPKSLIECGFGPPAKETTGSGAVDVLGGDLLTRFHSVF